MSSQTFGVDISAHWFDVAHGEQVRRFANTSTGITACLDWLSTFGSPVRVGMEATGAYHLPLATALHAAGHEVLVCNPLSIARYSQAVLARTKTDTTDARRIARFCEVHDVAPWTPASPVQQRLHALPATRETLVQERLRGKGKRPKVVITAVMRKLLLLAWTLLRTGQPFSATHQIQHAGA
jgi:transposase